MHETLNNQYVQDHVSNSQFYMIRCLIAMAHADGIVCDEEKAYISALTNRLPLTEEQEQTLDGDFQSPQNVGELLARINEPKFRAQVVYFARIMAYKDGVLDVNEESLLEKLQYYTTQGVDVEGLREQVASAVNAEMLAHDIKINNNRPEKGGHVIPWFQFLDEILKILGIDILRG